MRKREVSARRGGGGRGAPFIAGSTLIVDGSCGAMSSSDSALHRRWRGDGAPPRKVTDLAPVSSSRFDMLTGGPVALRGRRLTVGSAPAVLTTVHVLLGRPCPSSVSPDPRASAACDGGRLRDRCSALRISRCLASLCDAASSAREKRCRRLYVDVSCNDGSE